MRPYLYSHQNPNAPKRDNGIRFWGYPERLGGIKVIRVLVLHTAENVPDVKGADRSAENLAAYGARMERPASWHKCSDRDTTITCLPDRAVAVHAVGYNTIGLGWEICTQAHRWGINRKADTQLLRQVAWGFARWSYRHDIPLKFRTRTQVDAGARGVTTHAQLDPSRRTDPGAKFPMGKFLRMARRRRRIVRLRRKT
jgi:hypothetical protein